MPWARLGDNAATYPKLMMIAGFPGADERAVNEVRGWLLACATQSAGHLTDYVVDPGTAQMFGGARTKVLLRWCVRAGLLTPTKLDGVTHWLIVNDAEFIHIRTRAEVEWDRQRQRDVADVGLTVPVRLRDGDQCRYCGVLTQWRGKKSNRSAEYDHRHPGQAATVDTLVVACRRCNGSRQANPQWDDDHPLRPAPTTPMYSDWTARFLTENGYPTTPNVSPDDRHHAATAGSNGTAAASPAARPVAPPTPLPTADTADATTTSSADTAAATPAARPAARRTARTPDPGRDDDAGQAAPPWAAPTDVDPELPQSGVRGSGVSTSPGSGRDGSGGTTGDPPPARGRRRRGGRGGRSRTTDPPPPADPSTYDQPPAQPPDPHP